LGNGVTLPRVREAIVICSVALVAAGAYVGLGSLGNHTRAAKSAAAQVKAANTTASVPPDPSIKAFDSDNTVSDPTWFSQTYAAGFRLYILSPVEWGTCTPWNLAQPQIQAALAAGLKVAAYTRNPDCWQNGILATGPYQSQLQFFALDIETNPGIPATTVMVNGIKSMGVRPIIYSGSSMWAKIEGSLAGSFSNLPLWDSNSSGFPYASWQANYEEPKPIEYGGWNTASNMRVGVQQQIEYDLNGVKVDLDSFNATFLK
jgi:hypothetical protein